MFTTCLVAVDIVDETVPKKLIDAAVMLHSQGAALHVINVVPDAGMSIVGQYLGPDHARKVVDDAQSHLTAWAGEVLPDDAHLHVAQGNVYDAVLKKAAEIGADVILVGAHRPALQDYLVGPNAARIVRHANQSVIVIR